MQSCEKEIRYKQSQPRVGKPKLVKGNAVAPCESHNLLREMVVYPTEAKSCWRKCFCTLRKPKLVRGNAFVSFASHNLLKEMLSYPREVQTCSIYRFCTLQNNENFSMECILYTAIAIFYIFALGEMQMEVKYVWIICKSICLFYILLSDLIKLCCYKLFTGRTYSA